MVQKESGSKAGSFADVLTLGSGANLVLFGTATVAVLAVLVVFGACQRRDKTGMHGAEEWQQVQNEDGEVYFWNPVTNETKWSLQEV